MAGTLVDGEVAEPSQRAVRWRRWAVVGLAGLAALAAAGWWVAAAQQRAQVAVWFDARPVECRDGEPPVEDLDMVFDPLFVTVVDASAELDCWLRVWVGNRGRLPVTLRGLTLPFYGPGTGGGIHATTLSPLGVLPAAEDEPGSRALDALYDLDYPLEPGWNVLLRLRLEFNPRGCSSPGSRMWVPDAPTVDVSVLGLGGTRSPTGIALAQRGTEESSCDRP